MDRISFQETAHDQDTVLPREPRYLRTPQDVFDFGELLPRDDDFDFP